MDLATQVDRTRGVSAHHADSRFVERVYGFIMNLLCDRHHFNSVEERLLSYTCRAIHP